MTIRDAANILGVSESAIRKRLQRGTLTHEKRADGRVYILADELSDTSNTYESRTLISTEDDLRDQVTWLRQEIERKDTIIMQLSRSIGQLEAPAEPRESPETATREQGPGEAAPEPERRSWWQKLFGM